MPKAEPKSEEQQKGDAHQNGDPPVDGLDEGDNEDPLKELQDSIADVVESGDLSDPLKLFLIRFGSYLGGVTEQLNALSSSFAKMSEAVEQQGTRLADVDGKVARICKRLNVYIPMRPPDTPGLKKKEPSASGSALSLNTTSTAVKASAEPARAKSPEREKTDAELKEQFPTVTVIAGFRDPLAFGHFFPLRIGDYVFAGMEQALFYIKYKVMNRDDLAARVKKTTNPIEVTQVGTIATGDEWTDEVQTKVALALFHLRANQCKEFAEKVKAAGNPQSFVFATTNALYGCGTQRSSIASVLPDKFRGQNLYGSWLEKFADSYHKGLPDELPFDVEKYCKFGQVALPDKEEILVLGDCQLAGFKDRLNTKLVFDAGMRVAKHPSDNAHTAKVAVEKLAEGELEKCAAVVILVGTHEVGKTPDKLEEEYTDLLKTIRDKSADVAIFVGNALPRSDKLADKVDVTNYAIRTATKNFGDAKAVLLDLADKFGKLNNIKILMKPNGFELAETGAEKLAEFLAVDAPFVSMVCPKKPTPSVSSRGTVRGKSMAGPPPKRARGTFGQSRGSPGRFQGSRMSMPGGAPGFGGGFPVAGTQRGGFSGSPWAANMGGNPRMLGMNQAPYGGRGGMGGQGYYPRQGYDY